MDEVRNTVDFEMQPFVMRELAAYVMKKKNMSLEDALSYIYSSRLYRTLSDEDTKTWYLSTLSIYDLLEKEKEGLRKRETNTAKILLFKMFCIEHYRKREKLEAGDALAIFMKYRVFSFLEEVFETLHTQDDSYILDSISVYIKHQKGKK